MSFFDEQAYNEYSSSKNTFASAALILGGIAIITFSSIFPAIFAGSLSIIFAMLSRKGTNRLHPLAKVGAICSSISVILGILLFVFQLHYIPTLLQNEENRAHMEQMLETMYGSQIDTNEFLDDFVNGTLFTFPEEP